MPRLARWLSFALLPFAGFLDAAAYYGSRAVLFVHFAEAGGAYEAYGTAMMAASVASLFGTLLSGAIGLTRRPLLAAAAGAAFLLGACGLLAALPPQTALVGAVALGFAHGTLRTALWGAAAHPFGDFRSEHLRNAVCLALYGASNLAALAMVPLAQWVSETWSTTAVFTLAAMAGVPILLVVLGVDGAAFWGERERDALSAPAPREGYAHLAVIGGVLVVGGLVWALFSSGFDLLFLIARDSPGAYEDHSWLMSVNPGVVLAGCVIGGLLSVVLHVAKIRVSTLLPIGVGMLLVSMSLAALLAADDAMSPIVLPAVVLLSVGEVMVGPLLLSRVAGDVGPRLHTLAVAGFFLLSTTPMLLISAVSSEPETARVVSALAAGGAGLAGLGFIVAASLTGRLMFPDADQPREF